MLAEAEARNYDGIEYKPKNKDTSIIEQLKQPENRVVQEGPLVRTPSASPEVVDAVEPPLDRTARAAGAQAIVTESAGGPNPPSVIVLSVPAVPLWHKLSSSVSFHSPAIPYG